MTCPVCGGGLWRPGDRFNWFICNWCSYEERDDDSTPSEDLDEIDAILAEED